MSELTEILNKARDTGTLVWDNVSFKILNQTSATDDKTLRAMLCIQSESGEVFTVSVRSGGKTRWKQETR